MATYLSTEWLAEADDAMSRSDSLRDATSGVALVIQQVVTGGPDGADARYHVVVDHGAVSVVPGPAAQPDVTFTVDHATAAAIGRGDLSAQTAFMVGKLRVGGDLERLLTHQDAFSGIDDVFDELRAATTWPVAG
ncbi:MAG: SCP2 sterol-binding domain-containing protein [Actinomycetota bacterium]|nr:SCP2 sterol-binding domain-containing protein [Actinomycetota bacterium]